MPSADPVRKKISELIEEGKVDSLASAEEGLGADLVGFDIGDSGLSATTAGAAIRELADEAALEADLTTLEASVTALEAIVRGLDIKASVRAVATSNITRSGTQTIDGVSLVAGDRVLLTGQSTGSQNGVYVVAAGAWSRATDADASAEVTAGMFCWVAEGTTYADTFWRLTTNDAITLDTTALTFEQFGASYATTASLDALDTRVTALETILGESKVCPELANDSVYDYWTPPIYGSQTAALIGVELMTVDGVSTSAAGTYLFDCKKQTFDGGPTSVDLLDSSFSLESGLTDQTREVLTPTAGELTATLATRTFAVGDKLRMGAVSNNADLTGGNGIIMTPIWEIL